MRHSLPGFFAGLFFALALGSPAIAAEAIQPGNYYAAYYDGHYGEISDGYWGRHGEYFWYKDRTGVWHRDDGSHFKREAINGFALVHGSGIARQH